MQFISKIFIGSSLMLASTMPMLGSATDFDRNFCDSTMRLDYIFSGTSTTQNISLSKMTATKDWFGRRVNLSKIPVRGYGRLLVIEPQSGDTIYANAFSDLFLEWLSTDEAKTRSRAMQGTFLIPMPKNEVNVVVEIDNQDGKTISRLSHEIDPKDILIRRPQIKDITPHRYVLQSGDPKEKIDVAILAEGFTETEMDQFYEFAEATVESILAHEPFKSMADRFNFVAVASPSKDSGVSIPRFNDWKNTAFSSHFSTFYSNRYLTTSNVSDIHDVLEGIPYEHLIILANTEEYGGGGIFNSYTLTTTHNPKFRPVVVHEFGHSFGGLADEYFYEGDVANSERYAKDVEPWEQNVTTLVDFESKWADMVGKDTPIPTMSKDNEKYGVGVYEGAAYATKGVYRPYDRCRMRDNDYPAFCPVCQRAIARIIEFYTIDAK